MSLDSNKLAEKIEAEIYDSLIALKHTKHTKRDIIKIANDNVEMILSRYFLADKINFRVYFADDGMLNVYFYDLNRHNELLC
jgi:hypothetical protein